MSKNPRFPDVENLLLLEIEPLNFVINGHRFRPLKCPTTGYWMWYTQPNHSDVKFYFSSASNAKVFAKRYVNNHSWNFWNRLICDKVYHQHIVSRSLTELSYSM